MCFGKRLNYCFTVQAMTDVKLLMGRMFSLTPQFGGYSTAHFSIQFLVKFLNKFSCDKLLLNVCLIELFVETYP